MAIFGVMMIGTGIFVFLSGGAIVKSAVKFSRQSTYYTEKGSMEEQQKEQKKSEKEFKDLVKKGMSILYVVGITCILFGFLIMLYS